MRPARYITTFLGLAALLATGCGAPVKSAGEVSSLFSGDQVTLQDKASGLCDALSARDEAPTTKGMPVDLAGCGDAGRAALDYKKIKSFYFMGLDGDVPNKDAEKLIHKSVRAQVWLNKSLLGFAQAISGKLKEKKDKGDNTGQVDLPDAGTEVKGLVESKLTVKEEPALDIETMSFHMLLNLKLTGAVEAEHDIEIDGRLIDNAFAATVRTTQDQPYEKSIIKNFNAVILIIPHASDMYLDMFVDLNIHNIGLETLFKEQVNSFLSTGLKRAIDSLLLL